MAAADVPVICGPTAAGKSAIALRLAEQQATTIISADSRQIYRGFDIGTAKPTLAERARVPHRGIDIVDPCERYSAAQWSALAEEWIDEAFVAGRMPIVVGGSGLYLRALFDGLFDEPELDAHRRRGLEVVLGALPLEELRRWAVALDPERAHLGRTQLLRAIEVALLTGQRVSLLHRERLRPPRWTPRYLLVDPGPALGGRIAARVDAMLDGGWLDEVRVLAESLPRDGPAWKATGYRHVRALILGQSTRSDTRERIVIETRQYAKRQRTWFRHQLPAHRVTRLDPLRDEARDLVDAWWSTFSTPEAPRDA